jgi:hypothetical protein
VPMMKSVHFNSPVGALGHLEELQSKTKKRIVFRGESDLYPARTPSAYRCDRNLAAILHSYSGSLGAWVFDKLFAPYLEHKNGAPYLNGRFVGCQDLLGWASSDHGYTQVLWQVEGLLQHYERRTCWLDLTADPRVAIFFASFDAKRRRVRTKGVGYIYYLAFSEIPPARYPLIDLQNTSELLAKIVGITAERPRAQSAVVLRCLEGLEFNSVSFSRTSDLRLFSHRPYFPMENMLEVIDACELEYLEYLSRTISDARVEGYTVTSDFIANTAMLRKERLPQLRRRVRSVDPSLSRTAPNAVGRADG